MTLPRCCVAWVGGSDNPIFAGNQHREPEAVWLARSIKVDVFRPVVPVPLSDGQPSTLGALVDSGSEHTLAAGWLAEDLGVDLDQSHDRLLLGIGGRSVEAVFADVELRLYRDHASDEYVAWRTEVGFLMPWDAEFFVILGQIGFYDQFTVTMNRRVLTSHLVRVGISGWS